MSVPDLRPFWRRRLVKPLLWLLGLNGALFAVYTFPRLLQERTLAARVVTLRAEVERERATTGALRSRSDTVRSNARDLQRFYADLVGSKTGTLLPLLKEISGAAHSLGLTVGRAAYNPEEVKDAPLVRFVITMPIQGQYRQVVSLLDRLERSRHFVTVDQVQIRETQGSEGTGLNVEMSAYFRAEEGSVDAR